MTTQTSYPLKSVFVTTVAAGCFGAIYGLLGLSPSVLQVLFIGLAPLVAVILWVQNDARSHHLGTVQDLGFFVYVLWPALIPWYVIKTRGRGGWRLALLLLGAVVAPLVLTMAAAFWHDVVRAGMRYL